MRTLHRLDDLVELVGGRDDLFVRWSRGPGVDLEGTSRDDLTGVPLPGLSANALAIEQWWDDRSPRLWVARRLYDYRHLREVRGDDVRPWVMRARAIARGPDNEPLVDDVEPIAWLDQGVVAEAVRLVDEQAGEWGPLRRQ
jgi:hypothetical protein